jgi:hypothetical protein
MAEQNRLHFSEYDFGGFYDLDLSWDNHQLNASYFIPETAEEHYYISKEKERIEAAQKGDSYTPSNQFYIKCKSRTIYWENLETISYYEIIEPQYYLFRILLKTSTIGDEILIAAKTNENGIPPKTIKHNDPDILDTMMTGDRPDTKEERYLKEMYANLLESIIPFATNKISARYQKRLRANETIKIGELNIQKEGLFLNQKKGLFRKKTRLVNWHNIAYSIRDNHLFLKDITDSRTNLKIERNSLVNQDVIKDLINLGKKGQFG